MIEIRAERNPETREIRLRAKGHSGYADKGTDIVCSAASILIYTYAQIITAMLHHGDLDQCVRLSIEDGEADIYVVTADDITFTDAAHSLFVVCTGLQLLAVNYPKNIAYSENIIS